MYVAAFTFMARVNASEVPIFLETNVYCELLCKVRALAANVAHSVWFTAYDSTSPLAQGAQKTRGKSEKLLANDSS